MLQTNLHDQPKSEVLGVPITLFSMDQVLLEIEQMIASNQAHLVVTANSTGIVLAQSDVTLMKVYNEAGLSTPDSEGVLWALRRKGIKGLQRVTGVDLLDRICALSAMKGYRLFFLGAAPGVAEGAAERLRLKHPGCNIVGVRHGFFPEESDSVVAQEISTAQADVLFVALGIPRQEKFLARYLDTTGAKAGIGVGGSFDVLSGKVSRAPKLVQKLKLEWLWRLLQDPGKWRRALLLPRFVWMVLRSGR